MLDSGSRERSKTYVMNTQWMCGFPDKLVVASLDGYLHRRVLRRRGSGRYLPRQAGRLPIPARTIVSDEAIAIALTSFET